MTNQYKSIIAKEMFRLAGDGKKRKDVTFKYSQVGLSNKLGISNAYVSNMIAGKWDNISDAMWRKVQNILNIDFDWNIAETTNYVNVTELLAKVQQKNLTVGISYDAGVGKSQAYIDYDRLNHNVIYVECKIYWKTKSYVKNLLNAAGLEAEGTTEQMIDTFISHVMGLENPIIIIDQMDKLKEGAFDLFMDMYNDLFRCCGFVVSGVPALKKRILRGAKNDKIGYREAYSRLHKTFIELSPIDQEDVEVICKANGITDEEEISLIFNQCDGDLRIVRKDVTKYFILQEAV
ncbi:AAA family ATPase [Chryseobacterium sp. KCF3-3]|uniref:AAA family ATPase n=1 Tax=Chryseobacterium sp. KCF3-3 TaxID=3231511 RepID=UPI0038B2CD6B